MQLILHVGVTAKTLAFLQDSFQTKDIVFEKTTEDYFSDKCQSLAQYQVFLIGELVSNPIRFAQEAYSCDKNLSTLIITESINLEKIKRALQFSPFIGPTVQSIADNIGVRMLPIVEDAMQRTIQRRSFTKLKSFRSPEQRFTLNVLDKVRADYTSKVLQEAPIGVVLISDSGTVININHYALSLFDKSEKELLATTIYKLFPESKQKEIEDFVGQGYITQPKKIIEREELNGQQYLELSVASIDLDASAGYKLLILNNITATIIAQKKTQAHLEELEKLNANLARVNADLDTFVYTASHDLKSPILNIEGLITSLEEELGPDNPVTTEIEHMKMAVTSFKRTVEGLTEVSHLQKGIVLQASWVNLNSIWEEVQQLLEQEIADSGAIIDFKAEGNTNVFFPKKHLISILYNLVSNAIKYRSPNRRLHIIIRSWYEGKQYYLTVQDNGLGIPARQRKKVFRLFQRGHSHVEGSGVGLFILKRIIGNYGGQILLKSEEEKGSIFTVVLKANERIAEEAIT